MFLKKKQQDQELRAPSGWGAVLHKAVMCVTYPFRKPLYLLLILVLMLVVVYCVPLFYGVKPLEVHTWYLSKVQMLEKTDFANVSDKFSSFINQLPMNAPKAQKGTDKLVESKPTVRETRRRMFLAASGNKTQRVDVLAKEAADVVAVVPPSPQMPEAISAPEPIVAQAKKVETVVNNKPTIVKATSENELLRYVDVPETISGSAKIYNANEMEVAGTYLFLYGVYSNPRNARGVKAGVFLRDSLKGKTVTCKILAYTVDEVATGECFVDEVNINDTLVDLGYSDRVELR